MVLTQIMSVSAAILGIYIVFVSLLTGETSVYKPPLEAYHLGCFLLNHTHDQSFRITAELDRIQEESRKSMKVNMHDSRVQGADFDRKSIELSKKFDMYLDALVANNRK